MVDEFTIVPKEAKSVQVNTVEPYPQIVLKDQKSIGNADEIHIGSLNAQLEALTTVDAWARTLHAIPNDKPLESKEFLHLAQTTSQIHELITTMEEAEQQEAKLVLPKDKIGPAEQERVMVGFLKITPQQEGRMWKLEEHGEELVFVERDAQNGITETFTFPQVRRRWTEQVQNKTKATAKELGLIVSSARGNNQQLVVGSTEDYQMLRAKMGIVTHDFRSPLTIFIGYLDVMKDPEITLQLHDVIAPVNIAIQKTRTASEVSRGILLTEIKKENITPIAVRQKCIERFEGIELEISGGVNVFIDNLPENIETVVWSGDLSATLLANIRQNFVKAIQKRNELFPARAHETPELHIRFTRGSRGMQMIIEDNGTGFPDTIVKEARFIEGYSDWGASKVKGTGQGMALNAELLKVIGGRMTPENIRGQRPHADGTLKDQVIGSRIIVEFPFAEVPNTS